MRPSKGIVSLAKLKMIFFGHLFEEIKFTEKAKNNANVSMHGSHAKFNTSYMHDNFFCCPLLYHHSINASNSSKYCN